ncbi:MAG: sigma-54-dependent Fis family transcriptional regulator [Bradymonadia bacterium]
MDNTPLVLEDVALTQWSRFVESNGQPSTLVPSTLSRCWRRVIELGVDPNGERPTDHLLRGSDLSDRRAALESVWSISNQVFQEAAQAFSDRDYITLLTDRDGVVLQSLGGGNFSDMARSSLLIEGACWGEPHRGTNAIGTAIAEKRPVVVHGRAHFERSNHELVCYASPIRDPYGEVIAVLDATSFSVAADPFVHHAIRTAARAVEEMIRLQAYAGVGPGMLQTLSSTLDRIDGPAFLVERPGVIRHANVHALQSYALRPGYTSLSSLVSMSWDDLLHEIVKPSRGGHAVVDALGRQHLLRAEPIFGPQEQVLATLVILTPSRAGRSTPVRTPAPRKTTDPFDPIFCADPQVAQAVSTARRVARSNLPVMLLAESGTGKELFAQAIHKASRRADGPFVALNCGALSPNLLESELFGYGPGAFTGADRRGRDGQLQAAHEGTLFLDEVAEMPQTMQAMLLRVLETGRFHRVGETQERQVSVRLICATCAELPRMVAEKRFRSDLYYRLKGISLALPTLRARTDVVPLAEYLLERICHDEGFEHVPELSPEFGQWLTRFDWPGNVRELRTTLHCALIMSGDAPVLTLEHLPPGTELSIFTEPAPSTTPTPGNHLASGRNLNGLEGEAVRTALREAAGNVSQAARTLGVARSTLYRMMKRHGLD